MPPTATRRALLSLACIVFLVGLGLAMHAWAKPESRAWSGFLTDLRASPGEARLQIKYLVPRSPAARAGLNMGDEIIAVNGIRLSGSAAVAEAAKLFRSGTPLQLTIRRAGGVLDVSVTPENALHNPFLLTSILLNLVTSLAFAGVGIFVFTRKPSDSRALVFLGMSVAFGLTRLVNAGPYHAYAMAPMDHVAPLSVLVVSVLLIFPLLLHFCLLFPRTRPLLRNSPGVLGWIYGCPGFQLLLLGILVLAATSTLNITNSDPNAAAKAAFNRILSPFTARPFATAAGSFAMALVPALLIGRAAWRALRERGFRAAFADRPDLVAGSVFFVPLLVFSGAGIVTELTGSRTGTIFAAVAFAVFPALLAAGTIVAQSLIFPIGACVAFYRSYRSAGVEERQQMRWPLWGLCTAVASHFLVAPFAMTLAAVLVLDPAGMSRALIYHAAQYTEVLCLLLIPLSFAVAILKYRLMDIHLYIRRTVIYGAVTGLLGLMYLGLVGGLGALISQWTGARNEWWTALSTLMVAGAFFPVRNRVQSVVDTRFFRNRDYSKSLHSLSEGIAHSQNAAALTAVAAEGLQHALRCRMVDVLLATAGQLKSAARIGEGPEVKRVEISYRDALMGVLSLGAKLSDEDYDSADQAFLQTAAGQIAAGLENIRLQREQRDLEKAREIQEALLPSSIPALPGFTIAAAYQPARSVGGDYYDVIDLGQGRLAFVVADVSGKGLSAALLMSNLQAAVKAFSREQDSPSALCASVNRLICGNVTPGRYITFFYGLLDAENRRFVYTNAGHNPPILLRSSGDVVRLSDGGPILGFLRDTPFESGEIVLEPGDRLLIFTDGVSEAFGPGDEEFGDERLIATLRDAAGQADRLKDAVLHKVTEFCGGNFHDDATLIALCVRTGATTTAGVY